MQRGAVHAFNYVCEDPPLIFLGLQVSDDDGDRMGEIKDTTRNILRTAEFVVNLIDADLLADMVRCATDFPSNVSETTAMALGLVTSIEVATPRIERSPFALECRTKQILDLSSHRAVVIGEVLSILRPGRHRRPANPSRRSRSLPACRATLRLALLQDEHDRVAPDGELCTTAKSA